MKEKLITNINETYDNLIGVLSQFSEMNKPQPNNSWTAGQVCEHLILSSMIVLKTIKGKTEIAEENRVSKGELIKEVFLDFIQKMTAPDFILPVQKSHHKEEMLQAFKDIKTEISEIAETLDLTLVCVDFELPDIGKYTIIEWIIFCLCHTQRHTVQIEKIK